MMELRILVKEYLKTEKDDYGLCANVKHRTETLQYRESPEDEWKDVPKTYVTVTGV